jgi:hypothetical protein
MPRTRNRKQELSESWDDMGSDEEWEEDVQEQDSAEEEQRPGRKRDMRRTRFDDDARRATRSSREPQLVMPSSPNAAVNGDKRRDQTTRFRLNERSMTSDAGRLQPSTGVDMSHRARTPHFRMNARSFTSDAGRFGKKAQIPEEEEDEHEDAFREYAHMAWVQVFVPVLVRLESLQRTVLSTLTCSKGILFRHRRLGTS